MHRFANPARFMRLSSVALPWVAAASAVLLGLGLYLALFVAPADYQQGEAVRIMFVHVPSAWMATFVYGVMALAGAVALIWRHPLADIDSEFLQDAVHARANVQLCNLRSLQLVKCTLLVNVRLLDGKLRGDGACKGLDLLFSEIILFGQFLGLHFRSLHVQLGG